MSADSVLPDQEDQGDHGDSRRLAPAWGLGIASGHWRGMELEGSWCRFPLMRPPDLDYLLRYNCLEKIKNIVLQRFLEP